MARQSTGNTHTQRDSEKERESGRQRIYDPRPRAQRIFGHATQCCNEFRPPAGNCSLKPDGQMRQRGRKEGQRGRQGRTVTARLPPLALIKPRRHNKLQLPGIVTALSAWPACSACPESRAWPKTYPSQSTRRWHGAAEGQNEGGTKDVGPAVKIGS